MAATVKNEKISRAQRYISAGVPLPLVELKAGSYLLDAVQELGPIRSSGMGLTTPDWQEVVAFASANGLSFAPFEFRIIRKMCAAYLREFRAGEDPLCIAPIDRGKEIED